MRALIQRVRTAQVVVGEETIGSIGIGILVFLGIAPGDGEAEAHSLAQKIAKLRIFPDSGGHMNLSVGQVHGGILVVSQFTLYGECEKGNRPSFTAAARSEHAEPLYLRFIALLEAICGPDIPVRTGQFGADMQVSLVNWGPVTLWLER